MNSSSIGGEPLFQQIITLVEKIYNTGRMPKVWKFTITDPIFKKRNKKEPQNTEG